MIFISLDEMCEAWLNPIDDEPVNKPKKWLEQEFKPFAPREIKEYLLLRWSMGWDATRIILEMSKPSNGMFYCMTCSSVNRWVKAIIKHDRMLTGGKVLSELGELL